MTWILPSAKFGPAPGWHWPQVLGRLAGLIGDLGSVEVADVVEPVAAGAVGDAGLAELRGRPVVGGGVGLQPGGQEAVLPGQALVVVAAGADGGDLGRVDAGARGRRGERMSCSLWQSVQTGTSLMPLT